MHWHHSYCWSIVHPALQAYDLMLTLLRGQSLLKGATAARAGDAAAAAVAQAQLLGARTDPQLLLSRSPQVNLGLPLLAVASVHSSIFGWHEIS